MWNIFRFMISISIGAIGMYFVVIMFDNFLGDIGALIGIFISVILFVPMMALMFPKD